MATESNIHILSNRHKSVSGYVILSDIELAGLPDSVIINGTKLVRKDEFHITVIGANKVAEIINPDKTDELKTELIDKLQAYIKQGRLLDFKFMYEFRLAQTGDQKAVVVMCDFPDGKLFFDELRQTYGRPIPTPPFHITLYALPSDKIGIGISSPEELENITEPIKLPELKDLRVK